MGSRAMGQPWSRGGQAPGPGADWAARPRGVARPRGRPGHQGPGAEWAARPREAGPGRASPPRHAAAPD